ncbi:MAG: hypothetical protein WBM14_03685, partial [Terracidiphilus sp.]
MVNLLDVLRLGRLSFCGSDFSHAWRKNSAAAVRLPGPGSVCTMIWKSRGDLEIEGRTTMRPNVNLMKATLTGALGGLLFGFDTVVISGAIDALVRLY